MRAIDTKVLRDVRSHLGQLIAIALVIACGAGLYLAMVTTMRSLEAAQQADYARERFGHVFASLVRAPEHVAEELRRIPGVQRVQTRVVADVTLDVPGMVDAAIGRLVSIPDDGRPEVNDLRLRQGRLPGAGHGDEVVISEAFQAAHAFPLGARITALINGHQKALEIVGVALSPEYTWSLPPGQMFPDDERFGVLWMRRDALGKAFDLDGAFNDVSLQLGPDASTDDVVHRTDAVLDRYGGVGAIPRKDQQSHWFVENELLQLRTVGMVIPVMFLLVAAFLLNVVIGRMVQNQRPEIAALKAIGYRDREIGAHFAKLVGVVLAAGLGLAVLIGGGLGTTMMRLYADYYRFSAMPYHMGAAELVQAVAITALAASAGAFAAIRRTVRLPPAEAMRPEAPRTYRPSLLERIGVARLIPPGGRMVLREMQRTPVRQLLSIAGVALATALVIAATFFFDSIRYLVNVQFALEQRADVQVTLVQPRETTGALAELRHLPGVLHAEPMRSVPVRFHRGPIRRNGAIQGLPRGGTLQGVLDAELRDLPLPTDGIVLSRMLAEILGVGVGDEVRIEVLEGHRRERTVPVARVADTFIGTGSFMELDALCALLGETPTCNGAALTVDEGRLDELQRTVKRTPLIQAISVRAHAYRSLVEIFDENLGTSVAINMAFSLVMALGVLYNAARIVLAERQRELASLRVLGFRRREVSALLLGEIATLVVIALPFGLLLGRWISASMAASLESEQFRFPLVIGPATYALAGITVVAAAALSGWTAWRKLDRMDIIEVLKTRD